MYQFLLLVSSYVDNFLLRKIDASMTFTNESRLSFNVSSSTYPSHIPNTPPPSSQETTSHAQRSPAAPFIFHPRFIIIWVSDEAAVSSLD